MELVLPRLTKVITLWEFLMMKVERGRPPKTHLVDIYTEYEELHRQMKTLCDAHLRPAAAAGGGGGPLPHQLQVLNTYTLSLLSILYNLYWNVPCWGHQL